MTLNKSQRFKLRKSRVRKKIYGFSNRPRISVCRSNKYIYAQIIDDEKAHTLVSASNLSSELKKQFAGKSKVEQAKIIGEYLAKRAKSRGISDVVFDRSGYKYHGRIKALADAARAGGLRF